ncbi:hypothetical protein QZH41_003794 [Actinostola sp. cb2023]|nr:hypothetical protein QZH41_003794 [Actinostola sp. cb2023]
MSISDLLHALLKMSTTLVSTLERDWYPHSSICYITTPFGVLFGAASVFNLCAVAMNQYFVIVKPFHYMTTMTPAHARRVITGLWVGSIVISCPPIFWRTPDIICKSGAVAKEYYQAEVAYICALWVFVVIIPSIIMVWSYSNIFFTAREQILRMRNENSLFQNSCSSKTRKKELRVVALLALIGGIFLVCWVPFFIVMTLLKFSSVKVNVKYFKGFLFLMYSKSAINPILYTVMNQDLKRACKKCICPRRLVQKESAMFMANNNGKNKNGKDENGGNEQLTVTPDTVLMSEFKTDS